MFWCFMFISYERTPMELRTLRLKRFPFERIIILVMPLLRRGRRRNLFSFRWQGTNIRDELEGNACSWVLGRSRMENPCRGYRCFLHVILGQIVFADHLFTSEKSRGKDTRCRYASSAVTTEDIRWTQYLAWEVVHAILHLQVNCPFNQSNRSGAY